MASDDTEIERRFKIKPNALQHYSHSYLMTQWYLANTGSWASRCRITTPVGRGGVSSYEYTKKRDEIELKLKMTQTEFTTFRRHCEPVGVHKQRYERFIGSYDWEIDVYRNPELLGHRVVEVELPSWDAKVDIPEWVGTEITGVRCFSNASLSRYLNKPEEMEAATIDIVTFFKLDPNLIVEFGTLKVSSIIQPVPEGFMPLTPGLYFAAFLERMNAELVLNEREKHWLYNDPDITFLDLIMMTAFIRHKHAKIKDKVRRMKQFVK